MASNVGHRGQRSVSICLSWQATAGRLQSILIKKARTDSPGEKVPDKRLLHCILCLLCKNSLKQDFKPANICWQWLHFQPHTNSMSMKPGNALTPWFVKKTKTNEITCGHTKGLWMTDKLKAIHGNTRLLQYCFSNCPSSSPTYKLSVPKHQ